MDYRYHPGIRKCVNALARGEVIAYPTEAVWGLGCDPFNHHAVAEILRIKQRSAAKGLILVAATMEQISWLLAGLSVNQQQQLRHTWPGHVTWLIPHHGRVSPLVCGDHHSVAVRVSAHPVVQALCTLFGGPLVSTSANKRDRPPARNGIDVRRYFGKARVTIAPGCIGDHAAPSEIRDLAGNVLRS